MIGRIIFVAVALVGTISSSSHAARSIPPQEIYFAQGSAVPEGGVIKAIDYAIATDYIENPAFEIAGHTDREGSRDDNVRLACRRAQAVGNLMVARGVPRQRLIVYAFGETRPVVDTPDEAAEWRNRRVEISWLPLASAVGKPHDCVARPQASRQAHTGVAPRSEG